METSVKDRILGCLLGGACGDALGAPFEFMSQNQMMEETDWNYLIDDFWTDGGRLGAITDDTQLVAFTASALVASRWHRDLTEIEHLHLAYLTWHSANHAPTPLVHEHHGYHDRLIGLVKSQGDRAPDVISLDSLQNAKRLGETVDNGAESSAAVSRVAPIGLVYSANPEKAFDLGFAAAALTHGHRTDQLASGAFAMLIAFLVLGHSLRQAIALVQLHIQRMPGAHVILRAMHEPPWAQDPKFTDAGRMGFGWTSGEALAIAVDAVLTTDSLESAIIVACSHDGKGDTTASMAGNLAGALYGLELPTRWLAQVEMRRELKLLARKLCQIIPNCSRTQ